MDEYRVVVTWEGRRPHYREESHTYYEGPYDQLADAEEIVQWTEETKPWSKEASLSSVTIEHRAVTEWATVSRNEEDSDE